MKIIVNGALGHMGRILTARIGETDGMEVFALVDKEAPGLSFQEVDAKEASMIIDFSNAAGTEELLSYALTNKLPLLIATTGQSEEQKSKIKEASESIPIFYSGNMSLGVALVADLVRQTVSAFPSADVEIVETHHTRKVDAPSGTALMLAEAAKEARPALTYNMGRNGVCLRDSNEIGINSVRRGNIVGIHEVNISTKNETITIKHEAHDRALFADGAIRAAKFLAGKPAGLYDMKALVSEF